MATKLQRAVATCESYLRNHPGAPLTEAIRTLWDSFGLDRNDVLPHNQIWFPDETQENIQRALIQQVWMLTFAKASQLTGRLPRPRR